MNLRPGIVRRRPIPQAWRIWIIGATIAVIYWSSMFVGELIRADARHQAPPAYYRSGCW